MRRDMDICSRLTVQMQAEKPETLFLMTNRIDIKS